MSGISKRVSGSWVSGDYGIMKTATDTITTLPADIYANAATATVGLKGQTVQSGTPTPQNPAMPNGCGERTNNLFDKNGEILTGNGAVINITETGIKTIVQSQGNNRYSTIKLDNDLLGKTITISSTITQSANNKSQIRLFYVNGRYATSLITAITTAGQTGHISTTYTMPSSIPSGSDGIAIVLSADKEGDGEVGDYVEYADLMIVEGSTAPTSFIPYGYKIPISINGNITNIYIGDNPLRKSLDGTAYDTLASDGTLTQRVDSDGSVLATPVVTQITMPTFTLTDGANTISVDTTVQPSEVTVNYKGWHPVADVHERDNGAWT